jgi:hypothetical protein
MDSAAVASASEASWHMQRHVCRLAAEAGAVLVLQLPPSMLDDASMLVVASMLEQLGWQSVTKLCTCFSSCSTKPCVWRSHCLHSSSCVATPAAARQTKQQSTCKPQHHSSRPNQATEHVQTSAPLQQAGNTSEHGWQQTLLNPRGSVPRYYALVRRRCAPAVGM